jgi:hypothetical protein
MRRIFLGLIALLSFGTGWLQANPPVASYLFPAGGQRGQTVEVRAGGLFLFQRCGFELLGPGVQASPQLERTDTVWFEGPILPLPESQQAEDYPKDMAGRIQIAADAPLGYRYWRLWTSEGGTPALKFMVGDLPELVEQEIDGDPVPVPVQLPVTINGRIFPREDVDLWSFPARKGQAITCEVHAARLGTPLDARLEVLDAAGRRLAENDDGSGPDSFLRFTAPADGTYQVRIHDIQFKGGQAHVYRLTVTAGPHVDRTYPLGGRRGSETRFELGGQGLPDTSVAIPLPADAPQDFVHRVAVAGTLTNPFLLDLDDLPEHLEAEPNDEPDKVQPLALPAMLNGRIGAPGDVDCWAVTAVKGEAYELELRAARLGSPLLARLTVLDAAGKELARSDDAGGDPLLRFTAPADGTYLLRVEERFRGRGSPAHAYRLRIAQPAGPDFRLRLAADAVTLNRGGEVKLKVLAERTGGFAEAIQLAVEGLPDGVTVASTTIAAKQAALDLVLRAEAKAAIRAGHLTIRGSARVGDGMLTRTATLPAPRGVPELDTVLLAVALPAPFKVVGEYSIRLVPRGTVYQRHYRIERGGYDGPLEIRLADRQARHLQGVTGPTLTVPAGATEFDYFLHLPPWMELGRTCRACVMASGVIRDADGSEHVVSFSSTGQNEQIVAVIEPGRLALEAERGSITAAPGQAASIPVRITRGKSLAGPVKLELIVPAHQRGISAVPVEIPAGQDRAVLQVRFAADVAGPFNLPSILRATLLHNGTPVVAEVKLEIEPGP